MIYDSNKLIFILGGKGFVGSAFVRYCQSNKMEYSVIDRQNYESLKGKSCDVFINANGNSSKVLAQKKPLDDFDATVRSTKKSLLDFSFKKYVLLSSCDVYPDCSSPDTTKEDSVIDLARQSTYGFHKYMAEKCVQYSCPDWLIIRMGGMVGTGLKKNAIFDIVHGDTMWVDPQSELQFMNTDEVAKTVFSLIAKDIKNEIFNVCGDGLVKLQKIIDIVGAAKVKEGSPRTKYNVNIEKIKNLIQMPDSMESVLNFVRTAREQGSDDFN